MKNEQNYEKNDLKNEKKELISDKKSLIFQNKRKNRAIIALSIATGVLALSTLGFGIGYGITQSQANQFSIQLENIYRRNYYELVENVNSVDMKISKLLASNSETYQAKMLTEISQSSKEMQSNIASLPLSSDNITTSVRFINQMSGYTQVLEEKLAEGGVLSEADLDVLNEMHETLTQMKRYLNRMSQDMTQGYSILDSSSRMNGDFDEFTTQFAQIRSSDADYPTMIYDGPFSDSVVNQQVKGLSGGEISKEDAYKKVDQVFKNIFNLQYQGQTDGKFATYNFTLLNSDETKLYVQVTKIGGHILTVSGNVETDNEKISFKQAEKIALDFAKENGVENATVVWSETLNSQAYFNITPKSGDIILYPDLVKVKVDLEFGDVIGYDAMSYFYNHTNRNLPSASYALDKARAQIDESFEIKNERLTLAPLDYNREELCYEFECERNGATYYVYINATTGVEENILKVVKTSDGSKLM